MADVKVGLTVDAMCVIGEKTKTIRLLPATEIVKRFKRQFNGFKTSHDRKYFVYEIFGVIKKDFGYTVEKFSNQIILTLTTNPFWKEPEVHHDVTFFKRASPEETESTIIYDSENEELADPIKFQQFVLNHLRRILKEVKESG